jgi:MYXO-CTERM domain-containing protein
VTHQPATIIIAGHGCQTGGRRARRPPAGWAVALLGLLAIGCEDAPSALDTRGSRAEEVAGLSWIIFALGTAPSVVEARRARQERDLWGLMAALETPVIAQIHGWALGAGCEISLLCDLRIAADDARLGLPEVTLGYIPSAGGTQTLPRTVAQGDAGRLILSGEPVDAATALRMRLVHRVVPRASLEAEVMAVARTVAARPPAVIRVLKRTLVQGADLALEPALAHETRHMRRLLAERHGG